MHSCFNTQETNLLRNKCIQYHRSEPCHGRVLAFRLFTMIKACKNFQALLRGSNFRRRIVVMSKSLLVSHTEESCVHQKRGMSARHGNINTNQGIYFILQYFILFHYISTSAESGVLLINSLVHRWLWNGRIMTFPFGCRSSSGRTCRSRHWMSARRRF